MIVLVLSLVLMRIWSGVCRQTDREHGGYLGGFMTYAKKIQKGILSTNQTFVLPVTKLSTTQRFARPEASSEGKVSK